MGKVTVSILFLIMLAAADARAAKGCFHLHVADAVQLNRERAELYASVTGGASKAVTRRLILFEQTALAANFILRLDARAEYFQKMGLPIICLDLIDISETPDWKPFEPIPDTGTVSFQTIPVRTVQKEFRRSLKVGDYGGILKKASDELRRIEARPRAHCLYRHFLESIYRVGQLAGHYQRVAAERGLPSPRKLSDDLLRLHINSLDSMNRIDATAAPIQQSGVPILCRDVPHIPPFE